MDRNKIRDTTGNPYNTSNRYNNYYGQIITVLLKCAKY